jgi:hypothetical protein
MAPKELACFSVLAAVALGAQRLAKVNLRGGNEVPLSLFMMSIAESTERKSSVDSIAMSPVREFERLLAKLKFGSSAASIAKSGRRDLQKS